MLEQVVTKEAVILKLNDLPPDGLVEVARFIDFLRFKTGNKSRTSRHARVSTPLSASGADRPEAQDPVRFTEHLRRAIETRQDG